jgi:hypothetical protein
MLITYLVKIKQVRWSEKQAKAFYFLVLFLAAYTAFSTYAAPFELRYIVPIHAVQIAISILLINLLFLKKKEELIVKPKK